MTKIAQVVVFDGALLKRGFWLYVWEITTPEQNQIYYVGRTGDSSSSNAQSPFNRMSQHLGSNKRSNVLRRQLRTRGVEPELCQFKLVSYGPIVEETKTYEAHRNNRDHIAAMEYALAEEMRKAGYQVMNRVFSRKRLDETAFEFVRTAFASHFPAKAI